MLTCSGQIKSNVPKTLQSLTSSGIYRGNEERERERERERKKDRDRERETERQRDRETERQRERQRQSERERERKREREKREKKRDRDRQRDRDTEIQRETKRETDRQTERARQTETERDRDRGQRESSSGSSSRKEYKVAVWRKWYNSSTQNASKPSVALLNFDMDLALRVCQVSHKPTECTHVWFARTCSSLVTLYENSSMVAATD